MSDDRRRRPAALRPTCVSRAARGRRLVVLLGACSEPCLLAAHVRRVTTRRKPPAGRRLADLHDLRLDALFDPTAWRLEIGGLVRRPQSLDYEQLLGLPRVRQVSTFHCVTGWTVKDVHWAGVRLKRPVRPRGWLPAAKAVRFVSAEEPYNDSLTLDQARLPDVMLALELDGRPLSRPHGAPARVVIPEMYGYKGVKWLKRIELLPAQPTGYWEGLGYDQNAWVGRSNGYG